MPLAAPATAGGTRPGQREHGATILKQRQHRSESLRGYRPALCLDYWWEVRTHRQLTPVRVTGREAVFASRTGANDENARQVAVQLGGEPVAVLARRQYDLLDHAAEP